MTFIELVREVSRRVGLQGTGPASVDISSYETQLVKAVQDAWSWVQLYRTDWRWMRASKSFLTVADKDVYSTQDVFGVNPRLRSWLTGTFYIESNGQKSPLTYIDYDEFIYRHINDNNSKKPHEFTIRPYDNALVFVTPDDVYTIYCDYQKTPQELVNTTDTPEMPSRFHRLIIFIALDLYASEISFAEIQSRFSLEAAKMFGALLREQNPRTKLKVRGIA